MKDYNNVHIKDDIHELLKQESLYSGVPIRRLVDDLLREWYNEKVEEREEEEKRITDRDSIRHHSDNNALFEMQKEEALNRR